MSDERTPGGGRASGSRRWSIPGVVEQVSPPGTVSPVVLDSPHSGRCYPDDFGHRLDRESVRRIEDAYVDELFGDVSAHRAVLVHALFPRSYIDPNRAAHDIDVSMIDGPWPHPVSPSTKSRLGIGLIPVREPGGNLYDRRLSPAEVAHRIEGYYRPYHRTLCAALDAAYAAHRAVWHLNCHSMPGGGPQPASARRGAPVDVCIGDRDGTTSDPAFTDFVAGTLQAFGLTVSVNDPYRGVEIVRRYGRPDRERHSVQIELRRGLYLDEGTVEKSPAFPATRALMTRLVAAVGEYARARGRPRAAE